MKEVSLTAPEELFYDLLVDYEIMSMVKEFKTQVWVKTCNGYRRIDFVLVVDDNSLNHKGIYIEIDDPGHMKPERQQDDYIKTREIFNPSFPLLRFTYYEIFNDTQRVMNKIEGYIDIMKGIG